MYFVRITWREALKRFHILRCRTCPRITDDYGGEWYVEEKTKDGPYCEKCATKLTTASDPTRSVSQFYSNTTGSVTLSEHLE